MFSTACIGKLSENTEQQFIEKLAQGVFDDDREFVRSFLTEHKEVDANDFCLKDFKIRNDQKGHKVLRGWTLFHIAVFFKKRSMIKLLCELGADVNLCTKTEYKESPLALAAYTHTGAHHTGVKTIKLLLKLKADINPKSEEYEHTHMNDTVSGDYVGGASSFNDYVEKTSGCGYSDDDSYSINTDFSIATHHVPTVLSRHANDRAQGRFITKLDIQRTQKYGHKSWERTRRVKYIYKGTTVVAATDKPGACIITTYKDGKLVGQHRTEVKEAASIQTPHRERTRTLFGDSNSCERNLDARMASPAPASYRQVKLSPFGEAKPREENLKRRIGMHIYRQENRYRAPLDK